MATIKEVARLAGVAPSSVTRALSGHPNVSATLRRRVLDAVEASGYKPDLLAASLRRGSSNTIGVLVSDIINPRIAEMVDGVETELREHGYSVLLANSHGDPCRDAENVLLLQQKRIDGLLIMCVDDRSEALHEALKSLSVPVVLLDRQVEGFDVASAVLSDHRRGTERLTKHLLDAGHQRIAYLMGPRNTSYTGRQRMLGFTDALESSGVDLHPELVLDFRSTPELGQRATAELFELANPPTAVIVGPNPTLVGAMRQLQLSGIRVGRDIALACLDDVPIAYLHNPAISAVARDMAEMARTGAELLLAQLEGRSRPPRTVLLPTELFIRESTCQQVRSAGKRVPNSNSRGTTSAARSKRA